MAKGKTKQNDDEQVLEPPMVFVALPVEHRALQWSGDNFEALRAFAGEAVKLGDDGETLIVATSEGDLSAPVGHYVCEDAQGNFYPCSAEVHEGKYASAADMEAPEKPADPLKTATVRHLIDATIARIGRVEAIRGQKWPPMRVLAQELREHRNSFGDHPAMDESRY